MPSACLAIDKVQQAYSAQQIRLTLFTRLRLDRQFCATVLTPFTETIALNLNWLAAGDYAVVAQAQQANFTLTADEATANQFYLPLVTY